MDGAVLYHRCQYLARRSLRRDYPARRPANDLTLVLRSGEPRRSVALATIPPRDAAAFDADHCRGDDVLGAVHVHRLPVDLRADARRAAQLDPLDGDLVVSAGDFRRQSG